MKQDVQDLIGQIMRHAEENNDLALHKMISQLRTILLDTGTHNVIGSGRQYTAGDITGSSGVILGDGSAIHMSQHGTLQSVSQVFEDIYRHLGSVRAERVKSELTKLEAEISKGEEADESFLAKRFRNIALMGEDILDVVTATLLDPAAGIATVVRKIARKAREEQGLQPV